MKMKWSLLLGTFVICGLSVPAHAQIITEDMEAEINTLHQYIKMTEQYLMQGKQYATQIDQYIQQAKNAKGLGGALKAITGDDFTNIDSGEKGIKAAHDLLFNLDPGADGGYVHTARDLLGKIYNLPKENENLQAKINKIINKKGPSDDPASPNYDAVNRDVTNVVKVEHDVDGAYKDALELKKKKIAQQEEIIRDLGDDDVGASTQLIASELNTIEYQNHDIIELEKAISMNQQLDRIKTLEDANKSEQETLAALKKVKKYVDGEQAEKKAEEASAKTASTTSATQKG